MAVPRDVEVSFSGSSRKGNAQMANSIYFFCPDLAHVLGGVRQMYRHVDVLNANGFPIDVGDILGYARTMEEVIGRFSGEIDGLRKIAKDGAAFVGENYSEQAERESIVACWGRILGK
jgi:hypothetical protein